MMCHAVRRTMEQLQVSGVMSVLAGHTCYDCDDVPHAEWSRLHHAVLYAIPSVSFAVKDRGYDHLTTPYGKALEME